MLLKGIYCLLILVGSVMNSEAQGLTNGNSRDTTTPHWYVSMNGGYQMSGIKSVDFVKSNFSPLINITAGRWFVPYLALQIGYKGHYFYYIGDEVQHRYFYYYGEAALNINKLFNPIAKGKLWNLIAHAGAGYFYNSFYSRPNICANFGIQQRIRLSNQFHMSLDVSAVAGWDIYQGDEDVLPGIALGVIYAF